MTDVPLDYTVVHRMIEQAEQRPDEAVFTWIGPDGEASDRRTRVELWRRASRVAKGLAGLRGERVLLLHPPGLDFADAYVGCLLAGAVAVPVPLADPKRVLHGLRAFAADCEARAVLTTEALLAALGPALDADPAVEGLVRPASDALARGDANELLRGEHVRPDDVMVVQYTSGSTGTPRGVLVHHAAVVADIDGFMPFVLPEDCPVHRIVAWWPHYHDGGLISAFTAPLIRPFTHVHMSPATVVSRPEVWLRTIARTRAAASGGPNFIFDLCTQRVPDAALDGLDLSHWRVAYNGAEPIHARTLDDFARRFAPCGFRREAFMPAWGMAECIAVATCKQDREAPVEIDVERDALLGGEVRLSTPGAHARRLVSNGPPLPGYDVVAVDEETGERAAPGEVGELWIHGPSVTRGYWGRPTVSRERFHARLPDGSGPWLRSGDLGFVHDGEVYVTGRCKEVIIVRGDNHAPQDIEATSSQVHACLSTVAAAVSLSAEEDGTEGLAIVQGVSVRKADGVDYDIIIDAIDDAVTTRHGVRPAHVVLVPSKHVLRTTSGKIRRAATWAALESGRLEVLAERRIDGWGEDRTDRVRALLEGMLRERHGLDVDAVRDSFFGAGLDSLAVIELVAGLEEALGVRLPADAVWAARGGASLVSLATDRALPPRDVATETDEARATSSSQQAIWTMLRERPNSPAFNVVFAAELHGSLDLGRLQAAWDAVVARHPQLRARFFEADGHLLQRIEPPRPTEIELVDVGIIDDAEREDRVQALCREPFLQETGDLFRVVLLRAEDRPPLLVITLHHLAVDMASVEILLRDLVQAYHGGPDALAPARGRFGDLVVAEQALQHNARGQALRRFWTTELDGMHTLLRLPLDHPRHASGGPVGATTTVRLPAGVVEGLGRAARTAEETLHSALASLYGELIARVTGQRDVGILLALNRRRGGVQSDVVGDFVNLVPLRHRVDADTPWRAAVRETGERIRRAFRHADLPFAEVVRAVAPQRRLAHAPLSQVGFHLQRMGHGADLGVGSDLLHARLDPDGLDLCPVEVGQPIGQVDLYLELYEHADSVVGALKYDASLFDASTAERLARSFEHLCAEAARSPERPVQHLATAPLSDRERTQRAFNQTAEPLPRWSALSRFEATAAARPTSTAIHDATGTWDFEALDQAANGVAHALVEAGVRPDDAVAVLIPRSKHWAAAMLGVWKAGGVYVPLSAEDPDPLLIRRIAEIEAAAVVVHGDDQDRWRARGLHPVAVDDHGPPPRATGPGVQPGPRDRAYICFTSGSTGTGDGVVIEHLSLANLLLGDARTFQFTDRTRFAHLVHFPWEPSIHMLLGPLLAGGQTFIASAPDLASGRAILAWMRRCGATHSAVVTALLAALPAPTDLDHLEVLGVGGEACTSAIVRRWRPGRRLINAYGPTETASIASVELCEDDGREPTLGRPYPNVRVYVLGPDGDPVQVGEVGEITIGGVGVARGYVQRPEKTAARFRPDPLNSMPGARRYRSGDLGRFLRDGRLEYLGRVDRQVKVSGVRLQPEAVEAVLVGSEAVQACAVRQLGPRLAAWVVLSPAHPSTVPSSTPPPTCRAPPCPRGGWWCRALPLTPTGKVDRPALRMPDATESTEHADPRTRRAVALFSEVLASPMTSSEADFFQAGGDSLGLLRLLDRIEEEWGVVFSHAQFLEDPTPSGVVARLDDVPRASHLPVRVPLRAAGDRPPLFCVVAGYGDLVSFRTLTSLLPADQPVYALQPPLLDADDDLTELVRRYLEAVEQVVPDGPLRIAGYSAGGLVALEVAQAARRAGRHVDFLGMLDTPGELLEREALILDGTRRVAGRTLGRLAASRSRMARMAHFVSRDRGFKAHVDRLRGYEPEPWPGPMTLFVPSWSHQRFRVGRKTWERIALGGLDIRRVPGDHESFIRMPHVRALAHDLDRCLR